MKELATNADKLEEWTHTVLIPTLEGYSPGDIYNGDETALFTNLFLIELIAVLMTSLLVLQNIKTS